MSVPGYVAAIAAGLVAFGLLLAPPPAAAQEWRATAQVGRVTSSGAPASATGGSSAVLGIARAAPLDRLGISAALPVNGDPFWAAAAGWKRLATRGAVGVMIDLSAHGFVQRYTTREDVGPAPSPIPVPGPGTTTRELAVSGAGAGGEALAGVHAAAGPLRLEARGGATAQRSELGGAVEERLLSTADARVTLLRLPLIAGVETRGWWTSGGRHTYAGGTLRLLEGPVEVWGSTGGWIAGGVTGLVWAAGARTSLGPRLELQATARGNGFDPLYLTRTETAVAFGMSVRIGGRAASILAPVPAVYRNGAAEVRIPARGIEGRPSIAGDFTGWKPVAMERAGGRWIWRAQLAPGTYHYAFVTEKGTWFVPRSVPGRRDDGMGGQVAVLVVAP